VDAYLFTRTLLERLNGGESIYGKVSLTPRQRETVKAALHRLDQLA
jgi:predicted DNA binding protein